jgi:hypothetical protein
VDQVVAVQEQAQAQLVRLIKVLQVVMVPMVLCFTQEAAVAVAQAQLVKMAVLVVKAVATVVMVLRPQ